MDSILWLRSNNPHLARWHHIRRQQTGEWKPVVRNHIPLQWPLHPMGWWQASRYSIPFPSKSLEMQLILYLNCNIVFEGHKATLLVQYQPKYTGNSPDTRVRSVPRNWRKEICDFVRWSDFRANKPVSLSALISLIFWNKRTEYSVIKARQFERSDHVR